MLRANRLFGLLGRLNLALGANLITYDAIVARPVY